MSTSRADESSPLSLYTAPSGTLLERIERRNAFEQSVDLSSERAHIYLSELLIPPGDREEIDETLLCVLTARSRDDNREITYVALEEVTSADAGRRGTGIHVGDIQFGILPGGFEQSDLWFRVYRVQASRRARLVLDDIARLLPAIEYEKDIGGSLRVGEAILDRVAALAALPGVSIGMSGIGQLHGESIASYVVRSNASREQADLFALEGRLHGSSGALRETSFALIEIGPLRTGAGFIRALDQLLARRTDVEPVPGGDAKLVASESYHERDLRLR